ncbi:hypothetical protein SAMN04488554_3878 [Ruania alba]|uniref:Uncharacterized protein n=2 Tax=Ruania alba TaxID=648782 RepID=A0A1H5N2T1_9MICO|nr:hypothetical protein SAMN04488554_3878 [Ruania alba]
MQPHPQPHAQSPPYPPPSRPRRGGSPWGLLLAVPAVVLLVTQQVLPAIRTLLLGVETGEGPITRSVRPEFVTGMLATFGLGAAFATLGLCLGLVVGAALRRGSALLAQLGLGLLGLTLLAFAPLLHGIGVLDRFGIGALWPHLAVLVLPTLVIGGVLGAISRSARVTTGISVAVVLAGAAWSAQTDMGYVMGAVSPGHDIYRLGFAMMDLQGAAVLSVLLAVPVSILGIVAMLVLLASRARLRLADGQRAGSPAGVIGVVLSVVAVVAAVVVAWPWLGQTLSLGGPGVESAAIMARTLSLDLGNAAVLTVICGAAAIGIGYLRPIGAASPWLLLIFSPWFFTGLFPTVVARFEVARESGGLGVEPYAGLTPPFVVVPLLVLLTFIADGARRAREEGGRIPWGRSLAIGLLGVGFTLWVQRQTALHTFVFSYDTDVPSAQYVVLTSFTRMEDPAVGLLVPLPMLMIAAFVFALGVAAFGRMSLAVAGTVPARSVTGVPPGGAPPGHVPPLPDPTSREDRP